jgi:hypothetical protein
MNLKFGDTPKFKEEDLNNKLNTNANLNTIAKNDSEYKIKKVKMII